MISKCGLLLLSFLILFAGGCSESEGTVSKGMNIEKKYYLSDCTVKLDFLWKSDRPLKDRERIVSEVSAQVNRAIASGNFPMFSGHTTRELAYYVFYYADKCEDKKAMTQKLVDDFLLPNVLHFPSYEITDKNIDPGFDGVKPSGWWLDQRK